MRLKGSTLFDARGAERDAVASRRLAMDAYVMLPGVRVRVIKPGRHEQTAKSARALKSVLEAVASSCSVMAC